MFSTVRYFIKTSIVFLVIGISTGLYMSISKNIFHQMYGMDMISAHTHIILVGSVMMMIMGVALWFFPRAEKSDKKYNPDLIRLTYWTITISTSLRYCFQVANSFAYTDLLNKLISAASIFQVIGILIFFYSMWGRIRPVGSHLREAKGEKF